MEGRQRRLVNRRATARRLAALLAGALAGSPLPARGSSASELVLEARELEAAHEEDRAIRRYSEALAIDPTSGPAYLGLAGLRARRGDTREAERVYSVALEHLPALDAALVGRARVRRVLGDAREGEADLERYLSHRDDLVEMKELAAWYLEDGQSALALATWRRIYASSLRQGADVAVIREARATVRALQLLVAPADPVTSPDPASDPVRRGLAAMARRGA
jgi:tetratricopeptide (TPR) repeat protein